MDYALKYKCTPIHWTTPAAHCNCACDKYALISNCAKTLV